MYTQCPDCATVFRVTADALRAAQGDVRCGICATSFNALENLSEEPFRAAQGFDEGRSPDDTITVEEMPGTEVIELSTPAESATASELPASDDIEAASDTGDYDSTEALVADLQEIATVAGSGASRGDQPNDPAAIAASLSVSEETDRADEYPFLVLDEPDDLESPAARMLQHEESQPRAFETRRFLIPEEMRQGLAEEAAAGVAAAQAFDEPAKPEHSRRWPSTVAVSALALILAIQVVHDRRNELLRQPMIGPLLARAYALIGLPVAAPTDLAAYELRQWGAATDATQPGRLLLRASIVNRATYAQPFPLLRLALQDRFGTTIGVRDVEPVDYLPGTVTTRLLAPGQRTDAEVRLVDPGKDAIGFEMDVCLPSAGGVRCANEARLPR